MCPNIDVEGPCGPCQEGKSTNELIDRLEQEEMKMGGLIVQSGTLEWL